MFRRDVKGSTRYGEYCQWFHEESWKAWQARAALTAEKVAGQEAIYQVLDPIEGGWSDGPRSLYDATDGAFRRIVYAAPQQPAQSAEQDERAAHCVNTCNFYNKNRPCECPAPQSDAAAWEAVFDRVALELNCLPSSSPDGNEHVFHAIAKLRAASTQFTATQPAQTQVALTRAEIERIAGSCMDSGRYNLFMAYVDAALAKETNNG
jgi:hypothetical protein